MANEQNLVPNENRTPSERREIAQKAGVASGQARREKRDRHQRIKDLFALAVKDPNIKKNLEAMGIDVTNADLETAADACVMVEVLRKGNVKAWRAMKEEAYGKLDNKTSLELSGEISGVTINIKRYDGKEGDDGSTD